MSFSIRAITMLVRPLKNIEIPKRNSTIHIESEGQFRMMNSPIRPVMIPSKNTQTQFLNFLSWKERINLRMPEVRALPGAHYFLFCAFRNEKLWFATLLGNPGFLGLDLLFLASH